MQILWNLCKNGWEHSQKQVGSLTLNCVDVGKIALNIQITDDGAAWPRLIERDYSSHFSPRKLLATAWDFIFHVSWQKLTTPAYNTKRWRMAALL